MTKLTAKQKRFCEEYAKDLNAIRAYKAVYKKCKSNKSASAAAARSLASVNVAAYVRELLDKVTADNLIDAKQVIRDLIEVKNRCMEAVPVKVWDSELHAYVDSDAEYTFDSKGANNALKLLGDYLGMYQQKVAVSGNLDTGAPQLSQILDEIKNHG